MNWTRAISTAIGIALCGSVIGGLFGGTEAAELGGAFIALIFFKAGLLVGRGAVTSSEVQK